MIEKHCVDCDVEIRPKLYHPSSLRAEMTVWIVAVVIGAGAGMVSVFSNATATPGSDLQRVATSILSPEAPVGQAAAAPAPSGGAVSRVAAWLRWGRDVFLSFLAAAWWVLPIPLGFSLWRQFATYEGCAECGSRRLLPVQSPVPW